MNSQRTNSAIADQAPAYDGDAGEAFCYVYPGERPWRRPPRDNQDSLDWVAYFTRKWLVGGSRVCAASSASRTFGVLSTNESVAATLQREAQEDMRTREQKMRDLNLLFRTTMRPLRILAILSVLLRMTVFSALVLGPLNANAADVQIYGADGPVTEQAKPL